MRRLVVGHIGTDRVVLPSLKKPPSHGKALRRIPKRNPCVLSPGHPHRGFSLQTENPSGVVHGAVVCTERIPQTPQTIVAYRLVGVARWKRRHGDRVIRVVQKVPGDLHGVGPQICLAQRQRHLTIDITQRCRKLLHIGWPEGVVHGVDLASRWQQRWLQLDQSCLIPNGAGGATRDVSLAIV